MKFRIYRNPDATEWEGREEPFDRFSEPVVDVYDVPMALVYEIDTEDNIKWEDSEFNDVYYQIYRAAYQAYQAGFIDGLNDKNKKGDD